MSKYNTSSAIVVYDFFAEARLHTIAKYSRQLSQDWDKPNWALVTISDKEEIRAEITSLVTDIIR